MPRYTTPDQWIEELEYGLEYRRRFGVEDLWGSFEAIYYNVHESMMNDGANIFLSQGDAMLSMITVPSARVKVTATKPEEVDKAPIVETLDNTLITELDLATEMETASLHAYLFGRGIIKIGYDSEWGYDPSMDIAGDLQLGLTLTQLDAKGKRRIEYDSTIAPGSPWARAVMPHDIVVPWGVKEIDATPWIAHRVVRHIDDLRADSKYENTQRLQPNTSIQDFVESYRSTQKPIAVSRGNTRKAEYVEFYEIHERRTGKIIAIAKDHDKFLRREDNTLQIDNRLPFTSMSFTPRSRAFWTTPDVFYLYHIQNELSDVARQRTKQRRISTLKFIYNEDAISEEEVQKLLSPDVGVAAKATSGQDLSRIITKLDNTPNLQLAQEEDLLRANAREQIGFSRNQLGDYSGGRKTATEVATVDQSSRLRMSRRGVQVKRMYEDTIRTINNVVFQYWTLPRYVAAIGTERGTEWLKINGPALRGRYSYNVEFTEAGELQNRKLEALQLYGMLGQDPSIDPVALRNYLAAQINDPSFERLFNADIRAAMSEMRANGGARPTSKPTGQSGGVSQLLAQNGQNPQQAPTGLLAGGGIGS